MQINVGNKSSSGGAATKPLDESRPLYSPTPERAHTILYYGDSGNFKTWNALKFAEYMLERTGKITRYILSDLGGYAEVRAAAEGGLISLVNLAQTVSPMAAIMKLSRGEWPEITEDGKVRFRSWNSERDGQEIGAYIFDGLTSICALAMSEMVASGRKINEDVVGKFETYDETFGLVARGHYSQAQMLARNILSSMSALPVEKVFITALESKGEDEAKQLLYGPDTAGKALVDKLPAMVGDTFHVMIDPKSGERRTYFAPHVHPQNGVRFVTNLRLSGDSLSEWNKRFPSGYFLHGEEKGVSIADFLRHHDKGGEKAISRYQELVTKFKKN